MVRVFLQVHDPSATVFTGQRQQISRIGQTVQHQHFWLHQTTTNSYHSWKWGRNYEISSHSGKRQSWSHHQTRLQNIAQVFWPGKSIFRNQTQQKQEKLIKVCLNCANKYKISYSVLCTGFRIDQGWVRNGSPCAFKFYFFLKCASCLKYDVGWDQTD